MAFWLFWSRGIRVNRFFNVKASTISVISSLQDNRFATWFFYPYGPVWRIWSFRRPIYCHCNAVRLSLPSNSVRYSYRQSCSVGCFWLIETFLQKIKKRHSRGFPILKGGVWGGCWTLDYKAPPGRLEWVREYGWIDLNMNGIYNEHEFNVK